MVDRTEGAGVAHGRHENSARPSVTPKPQQQKGGKQHTTTKLADAEWHTLIDTQ